MPTSGDRIGCEEAQQEILRRDRLLAAILKASEILSATQDVDRALEQTLAEMGRGADADLAFVSPLDASGATPLASQIAAGYTWLHPECPVARAEWAPLALIKAEPEAMASLNAGKSFFVDENSPPGGLRRLLQNLRARAFLALPFKAGNQLPCLAGFAIYWADRHWSPGEQSLLRLATNMLGGYLARHRIETALRHRTADLIAANEQLAKAGRLKDEFLASMSHELRTPLNAILGLSESLLEKAFGPLNDSQTRYLGRIEESGRHLLMLINDILDLSKIEAGKLSANLRETEIESVCDASLRLVREQAHKKSLEVCTVFDPAVKRAYTDERLLKQMLVNLLTNAVKFTPLDGNIGLEVAPDGTGQWLEFVVWDTGIGIAEENLPRLFQPFVQLDSSLSRQFAGTGLGLSLVKRMATILEGDVRVESQLNQGSRFTLRLPWIKQAPAAEPDEEDLRPPVSTPVSEANPPSGQPRSPAARRAVILLAEDNPVNITMLKGYLEHKGFRLLIAMNGEEAIHAVETTPPDLILMDIQMPGMDGLEATRQLKANPAYRHIPIIVQTALAMPGDRQRCLAAGANEYFSKPSRLADLLAVIERQLAPSSASQP